MCPTVAQQPSLLICRVLSKLGMQQIQRHYFSASEKDRTKLPAHRYVNELHFLFNFNAVKSGR